MVATEPSRFSDAEKASPLVRETVPLDRQSRVPVDVPEMTARPSPLRAMANEEGPTGMVRVVFGAVRGVPRSRRSNAELASPSASTYRASPENPSIETLLLLMVPSKMSLSVVPAVTSRTTPNLKAVWRVVGARVSQPVSSAALPPSADNLTRYTRSRLDDRVGSHAGGASLSGSVRSMMARVSRSYRYARMHLFDWATSTVALTSGCRNPT